MKSLSRLARYYYLKLISLKEKPHTVALGLAIGVFVGCTPTVPVQMALAVSLAIVLRGSKVAAAAGVWISNPLNLPVFYYAEYLVGRWILGWQISFKPRDYSIFTLISEAQRLIKMMTLGGVVIGVPAALITYLIAYKIVAAAKTRREQRLAQALAE